MMKKYFWTWTVMLMAMATSLASCSSSSNDNGSGGLEPGQSSGTGSITVNGASYTVYDNYVHYEKEWAKPYGLYTMYLSCSNTNDEENSDFIIQLSEEFINIECDLTQPLIDAGGGFSYIILEGETYFPSEGDFKNGTLLVTLDEAGNMTIEAHGVANNSDDDQDDDAEFHISWKGTVSVDREYGKEYAPEPDVPWGDGYFKVRSQLKFNGVTKTVEFVRVHYWPGPAGFYEIEFLGAYESQLARLSIPLDLTGRTLHLTDPLISADDETCVDFLFVTGYSDNYYYPKEGDFKSGTLFVSIDSEGNMKLTAEGIANLLYDEEDCDLSFSMSFEGKGKVFKNGAPDSDPIPGGDFPYGDGTFTGNSFVEIEGSVYTINEVNVLHYDNGRTGALEVQFFDSSGTCVAGVQLPLDHMGSLYDLTDNLTGADGCSWAKVEVFINDEYKFFYTDENDFVSGHIKMSIDTEGNLSLETEGVGNDSSDDSDSDVSFTISFSGSGEVYHDISSAKSRTKIQK